MSHILDEVTDGIATITIDGLDEKHAMTNAVLGEFTETVRRAGADEAARVIIVTGR